MTVLAGVSFISLFDVIVVSALAVIVTKTGKIHIRSGWQKLIYIALLIWIVSIVASDIINSPPLSDTLSRLYLAIITLHILVFLDQLFSNPDMIFKSVAEYLFLCMLLLSVIASRRGFGMLPTYLVLALFSVLSLMIDSRLYFGGTLVGFCLGLFYYFSRRKLMLKGTALKRRPILVMIMIIGISTISLGGFKLIQNALFNGENTARYEQQNGALGSLVGSRIEVLGTIKAIQDRPLIGHGSWARNYDYVSYVEYERRQYGYQRSIQSNDIYSIYHRIPNHSFILGSWMEVGIMTGVSVFLFEWNVLFSTLSNDRRFYLAVVFFFLLVTQLMLRERSAAPSGQAISTHLPEGFFLENHNT